MDNKRATQEGIIAGIIVLVMLGALIFTAWWKGTTYSSVEEEKPHIVKGVQPQDCYCLRGNIVYYLRPGQAIEVDKGKIACMKKEKTK